MRYKSHECVSGTYADFKAIGKESLVEETAFIFYPDKIEIGDETYIGHEAMLYGHPYHSSICIRIGSRCWIGPRVELHGAGGITIEDDVGIGRGVSVATSQHDVDGEFAKVMDNPIRFQGVRIKKFADIGEHAIILPGITIGEGAVVGAGAVVTHDIPDYEIWAGNPARKIRDRERKTGPWRVRT